MRRRPGLHPTGTTPSEQKEGARGSPDPGPGAHGQLHVLGAARVPRPLTRSPLPSSSASSDKRPDPWNDCGIFLVYVYPQFLASRPPADCPQVWAWPSFLSRVQRVDIGALRPPRPGLAVCRAVWGSCMEGPTPGRAAGGRCASAGQSLVPTIEPAVGWLQSAGASGDALSAGFGKDSETSDEGSESSRATVLPQNRWSHTKRQIRNFLVYFYCKICAGRGRAAWECFLLLSLLAAHERQPSPARGPGGLRRPPPPLPRDQGVLIACLSCG